MDYRTKFAITGNAVGDFIASSFLYPQALLQMEMHLSMEAKVIDNSGNEIESRQHEHLA